MRVDETNVVADAGERHDSRAPALEFDRVVQDFRLPSGKGSRRVLDTISFAVRRGQFTAIVGPSGCGKSTLLHMAAGLLAPTSGAVRQDGVAIASVNRAIGFVPQQAQLLAWKTLRENVELPLLLRQVPRDERTERVREVLAAAGLAGFEDHYPHQLSGGMQKRASIARTLVYRPATILMDEPFGSLDAQTRETMQSELTGIWERTRKTIFFVTHDIDEAVYLGDRVVVLSARPARVREEVAIALPRPRDVAVRKSVAFLECRNRIWDLIREEKPS